MSVYFLPCLLTRVFDHCLDYLLSNDLASFLCITFAFYLSVVLNSYYNVPRRSVEIDETRVSSVIVSSFSINISDMRVE